MATIVDSYSEANYGNEFYLYDAAVWQRLRT